MLVTISFNARRTGCAEELRREVAQQVYAQFGAEGLLALAEALGNPGFRDYLEARTMFKVAGVEVPPRVAALVRLAGGEVSEEAPGEEELIAAFVSRQPRKRGRKPAGYTGSSDPDDDPGDGDS